MKEFNKKTLIPIGILGATALTAVTIFTSLTLAATSTDSQSLTQRLASKLNLDQVKVDSAFQSIQNENFANQQAQEKIKLDQAVKDGVITADQETLIIDKQKELYTEREKQRQELERWIADNKIDQSKLQEYGVGIEGFGRGHEGYMRRGMINHW